MVCIVPFHYASRLFNGVGTKNDVSSSRSFLKIYKDWTWSAIYLHRAYKNNGIPLGDITLSEKLGSFLWQLMFSKCFSCSNDLI